MPGVSHERQTATCHGHGGREDLNTEHRCQVEPSQGSIWGFRRALLKSHESISAFAFPTMLSGLP